MNQEYLWSKTGSDPEVARLESLLSEFRFDGNAVPELPTTNMIPVARTPKRRFVLGLSFAATAAALVLAVIWIARAPVPSVATRVKDPKSVPEFVQQGNDVRSPDLVGNRNKELVSITEPAYLSRPKKHEVRTKLNRTMGTARPEKAKLTKEEKYAYDRLMFALAVAGSKLKMVQDSVDRKHDAGTSTTRNRK